MTIDAARSDLRVREVELPLRHRPTGRDLRRLRPPRAAAARHALRLRAARRELPRAAPAARRLEGGRDERSGRRSGRGPRPGRRSVERAGARLSRTPRFRPDDRRPQAGRYPSGRAGRDAAGLRCAARRARGQRAESARHPARSRTQGVPRGGRPARRSGWRRRPPASLRSSGDGDARGRGVERAGRPARLEFREAIHGTRPVGSDRRPRRPHDPRRANVDRRVDRHARPVSRGSIGWDERELLRVARRSTSS